MRESQISSTHPRSIAIIGAACRLPGIPSVQAFWDVLTSAEHTVSEPTPARRQLFSGRPLARGGFLDRIDGFDASFFGISPHQAIRLDPHHRLLLEVVWEALEDAGLPTDRLAGTRTGVYTSCPGGHYWQLLHEAGMTDMHAFVGAHRSSTPSGRVAHLLDLRGPAFGVDATCASSLVAVHLACQAILAGEIDTAIVGAANLLLLPEERSGFADAGILSPTDRCRFGDRAADGYVPAEGAVTVVLKPLEDAIAAGDQVYATILGSGVSSNGNQAALSVSATGTVGQEDLLRTTMANANIAPTDLDYVEAHGPGTPEGDIVELTALRQVLREGRDPGRPCLVGSVKSNIGHTEVTAGLAGLLKTALALRHRIVPATLHVREPIPVIAADNSPVRLVETTMPLGEPDRPAVAGVTALGLFGIGAHAVLTEAPPAAGRHRAANSDRAMAIPLSAKDPAALAALAAEYAETLAAAPDPVDVCYSAGAHRTDHPFRLAIAGPDRGTLVDRLRRYAEQDPLSPAFSHTGRVTRRSRVVFVFSGQGSQWLGMARELMATEPVFAGSMRECDELVGEEREWSLIEKLHGAQPLTIEHEIQPALWAIQVSLARLLRHWGIEPDLTVGHSMGEVAAATIAGALSPRDGARVICRRSALLGELPEPGVMVAVELGEQAANEAIGDLADRVSVAAVNSDYSTVLAGEPDAVATVLEPLRERGVFCRVVRTNCATHVPSVERFREPLFAALAELRPRPGEVPMYSTALDRVVSGRELDAAYWMANLRQPVRFGSAVRAVLADRTPALFIELSPHPLLVPAIEEAIEGNRTDVAVTETLVRETSESESVMRTVAAAYVRGDAPDWSLLYEGGRFVPLPTYPWQRTRYWVDRTARPVAAGAGRPWAGPAATEERTPVLPAPPTRLPATSARELTDQLVSRAATVLSAPPESIDRGASLQDAGLDSLLSAKLSTQLTQEFDLKVTTGDLLDDRPLAEVAELLHRRLTASDAPSTVRSG